MQGQRSSLTTLPGNLSFDHGSTSSDMGVDSQLPWTTMQTSTENPLPEYRISSSEINARYLHHVRHEGLNGEWSLGESSSGAAQSQADHSERKKEHAAQSQADHSERKKEHAWSIHSRVAHNLEVRQHESSNVIALDTVDVDRHGDQTANRSSILQIPSPDGLPQDLNVHLEIQDDEDDECQVVERPSSHTFIRSSNEKMPSTEMEDVDYRPRCSLDGKRISCKRKALEVHVEQSSGAGTSACFEHAERSQWHSVQAGPNLTSNVSLLTRAEQTLDFSNGSEQANSGVRLGDGGTVSSNPSSLSARRTVESSRRNLRLRVNGLPQQDHTGIPFSTEANVANSDISSLLHSSRLVRSSSYGLNPSPAAGNGSHHIQSVLSHVPSVRRSTSASRTSNLPASVVPVEMGRDAMLYDESSSRNIRRRISEHAMFVPASERRGSSQLPTSWNMAGGSTSIAENVASSSRGGSTSWANSSSSTLSRRRLSEIVRRSLLSSAGTGSEGQSSNHAIRLSSSGTSQEMPLSSGSGGHCQRVSNSRTELLERRLDGALGMPYPFHSLATAGEGRSSIMSEIRQVFDLMRRGEGLRFEDMMMLNHPVLFGMAHTFDRHRDMRMDVDNMSYEELLALGERIGSVCTGLDEETIMLRLKRRKLPNVRANEKDDAESEPCCICREEYDNGEDIGILECGHDFHCHCIKQWLMHKNLCPICKTTGLTT